MRFSWPAASDDVGVTEYRLRQDDLVVAAVPGLTADVTGLDPDVTYTFAVDAVDAAGNPGEGPTTTVYIGVPDPVVLAPPLDTTVPTTLHSATSFLYTGPDAIQKGVVAGTIAPHRTALLRGRVLDRAGEPIRDVRVTILGFPELGHTRTRADGMFDLVVNGGGPLTLDYDHPAYFPAQRRLEPDWETPLTAPDVVLVPPDPVGTEVTLDAPMAQVARGSRQEDEDGARQATLIIPPGTTATMKVGALEIPLSTARIRATEYTVGATGRRAMPAGLPRASAYTYAVELSVDEAEALGAHTVTFSQPIAAYLENFLDLPVGEIVPSGYYDRRAGQWVPSSNGRAVRVVGESAGLALLDVTGDGIADSDATLTTLGITDVERAEVAALYDPGRSLWRVPVAHFSPWDWNLGWGADGEGTGATGTPTPAELTLTCEGTTPPPTPNVGSVIECENRALGESIPITGTGLSLHYTSMRAAARSVERTIRIPLTDNNVPTRLRGVTYHVDVAGRRFDGPRLDPIANQTTTFTWDGRDAYGRTVQGTLAATVTISYLYDLVYKRTATFAAPASVALPAGWTTRRRSDSEVSVSTVTRVAVGSLPAIPSNSLGGWTLSARHELDRGARTLHRGDGSREEKGKPQVERRIVGPEAWSPALAMVVAGDGTVYHGGSGQGVVWKTTPDGITTAYAGRPGQVGFAGDGGPATSALIRGPSALALAPDGSLYILDQQNVRIRRVSPSGIITTVAGNGTSGDAGDGLPATQAQIRSNSRGMALGEDGSLYVEAFNRIRRVGTDGIMTTFASGLPPSFSAHAVAADPQGGVYWLSGDDDVVIRLEQDGTRRVVAGNGDGGSLQIPSGTGGPATEAFIRGEQMAVAPDGTIYLRETWHPNPQSTVMHEQIRRVDPDGVIRLHAGGGPRCGARPTLALALQASLCAWGALAVGPRNTLYASGQNLNGLVDIFRVSTPVPSLHGLQGTRIASADGAVVHELDRNGRHLATRDAMTGVALATFGYGPDGNLATVVDEVGNTVTIEREPGRASIMAPFGQRTELRFDAEGYLERVIDPLGESVTLTYARGSLLASFSHPQTGTSTFSYDESGRLIRDTSPGGGYKEYSTSMGENGSVRARTVTRTTRLGRNATHEVVELATGDVTKRITDAAGLAWRITRERTGVTVTHSADGTVASVTTGPDPRVGMDAESPRAAVTTFPSGRSVRVDVTDTIALQNPADPLSVVMRTVTAKLNKRPDSHGAVHRLDAYPHGDDAGRPPGAGGLRRLGPTHRRLPAGRVARPFHLRRPRSGDGGRAGDAPHEGGLRRGGVRRHGDRARRPAVARHLRRDRAAARRDAAGREDPGIRLRGIRPARPPRPARKARARRRDEPGGADVALRAAFVAERHQRTARAARRRRPSRRRDVRQRGHRPGGARDARRGRAADRGRDTARPLHDDLQARWPA